MMLSPKKFKLNMIAGLLLLACSGMTSLAAEVVTDIEINSLISKAIQTHPLVGSAKAEQEATTEGITAAKLSMLPYPSISTGYDKDNSLVSQVNIRQPLWTGGKLTADVNRAIFDDKTAVENIYEKQNEVAKTTIEAWQGYITAVAQQRLHLDNLEQLDDFEQMMTRRVNQGVSAKIELDVITNRILQEQNAYQAAVEQQRIAAARLEQITGHPIAEGSSYTVPELSVLVEQAKLESVGFEKLAFNEVSFYNPAVIKEYFQIESAKEEVKAKKASRYPALYAEYEHVFYHNSDDEDKDDDGKFSLGLNYEPGAGFSNLALARASEARVNSLIQNQEAARRNVMENIQIQYQQFVSAKNKELSLVAAVAGAQIVLNSYRRQFIAGRKQWDQVLNAVRELGDYKNQLVQTRSDILASFYKLQVDFGLMPWQKFATNRENVERFSVGNEVKSWLEGRSGQLSLTTFEYDDSSANDATLDDANSDYVALNLPQSAEQRLNDGAILMINDDQTIEEIKGDLNYQMMDNAQGDVIDAAMGVNSETSGEELSEDAVPEQAGSDDNPAQSDLADLADELMNAGVDNEMASDDIASDDYVYVVGMNPTQEPQKVVEDVAEEGVPKTLEREELAIEEEVNTIANETDDKEEWVEADTLHTNDVNAVIDNEELISAEQASVNLEDGDAKGQSDTDEEATAEVKPSMPEPSTAEPSSNSALPKPVIKNIYSNIRNF